MRISPLALVLISASTVAALAQSETTSEKSRPQSKNALRQIEVEVVLIDAGDIDGLQNIEQSALIERLTTAEKQADVSVLRLKLKTLDARKARLQLGANTPTESARSLTRSGQSATSYSYQQIGTIFTTTPTLQDDDSIVLQYVLERTRLASTRVIEEGESAQPPPTTETNQWESIVRLKSGEPLVVSGQQLRSESKSSQTWLLITATASDPQLAEPAK